MLLYLIRHGESESNRADPRLREAAPWRCPELTDWGREQAQAAGLKLQAAGIERLYSSPLLRALQTAAILEPMFKCPVEIRAELSETFFGSRAPLLNKEIARRFPTFRLKRLRCTATGDWFTAFRAKNWQDIHTHTAVMARELRSLANKFKAVAAVIHGGNGSDLLDRLLGAPPADYVRFEFANCSISLLEIENGRLLVKYLNQPTVQAASKPDIEGSAAETGLRGRKRNARRVSCAASHMR